MPRTAVIAIAVLVAVALVGSTTFALVRSTQLRASQRRIQTLEAELQRARSGAGPRQPDVSSEASSEDPDNPQGGLFSEPDVGMEELFGLDAQQLARCVQPAGQLGSRDVPDAPPAAQIDQIGALVTELRGLRFEREPAPEFLNAQQIAARLQRELREEYTDAEAQLDRRVLAALGAVPRDIDLFQLQIDLLTSQVAGYYDPETEELVVRGSSASEGLSPTAQSTLAHELQHAVADQQMELPVDVTEDIADSDAALAARSLIEGDASLTQQQFSIVGLSLSEQLGLSADPDALADQRQLAQVPHYLAQSLQFPYIAGLGFVCDRFLDGGWQAVDASYDDLPTTSAQILDPARYPNPAVDPRNPGQLGGDWKRARASTLGAADLLWLFQAPGNDRAVALDSARQLALSWTGGELVMWTTGDATAVGVALTQRAGGPLCDAVTTWYERAFPDDTDAPPRSGERAVRDGKVQDGVVVCDGTEVRLGIAPDLPTARVLAG